MDKKLKIILSIIGFVIVILLVMFANEITAKIVIAIFLYSGVAIAAVWLIKKYKWRFIKICLGGLLFGLITGDKTITLALIIIICVIVLREPEKRNI